jgi:hypothetical protein
MVKQEITFTKFRIEESSLELIELSIRNEVSLGFPLLYSKASWTNER